MLSGLQKSPLILCHDSHKYLNLQEVNMSSKNRAYEERTEEMLKPITQEYGVEIYDVEYVKEGADYYLRAFIDKPDGVNIQDCENVSRALSDALDEADFIPDAYILEVSSPGLGRKLTKDRHLEKSIGKEVEIKLYKPLPDTKTKEYSGVLTGFDDKTITVSTQDEEQTFERQAIAQIRLALDFE